MQHVEVKCFENKNNYEHSKWVWHNRTSSYFRNKTQVSSCNSNSYWKVLPWDVSARSICELKLRTFQLNSKYYYIFDIQIHFLAGSGELRLSFTSIWKHFFNPTKQGNMPMLLVGNLLPYYPGISVNAFEVFDFDVWMILLRKESPLRQQWECGFAYIQPFHNLWHYFFSKKTSTLISWGPENTIEKGVDGLWELLRVEKCCDVLSSGYDMAIANIIT